MKRSDFLQRLVGIAGFGTFNLQALIPKRKIYLEQFFVAGFRHYKGMELMEHMQPNDLLELRREPDNEHDECAIALYWQQEKIGFVPASLNEMLSRLIDAQALPLLGMITHLNKQVKPWENVAAAIYFLQDESINIPQHAQHLKQIEQPVYTTTSKNKKSKRKEDLFEEVFNDYNGIVDIDTIQIPEIKNHYEKYFKEKKYEVSYNHKIYANISNNDIYTYMYNVKPLHPVLTEKGERFVLFEFAENPDTDDYYLRT
jgi:hypothetical protein